MNGYASGCGSSDTIESPALLNDAKETERPAASLGSLRSEDDNQSRMKVVCERNPLSPAGKMRAISAVAT